MVANPLDWPPKTTPPTAHDKWMAGKGACIFQKYLGSFLKFTPLFYGMIR
jgi:hypothetical protein